MKYNVVSSKQAVAIFFLISTFLLGCSGIRPASQGDLNEIEVIEQHSLSQDLAYTRLLRWVAESYNSANNVIQLQDKDAGAIVIKGAYDVPLSTITMFYTMSMDVRDQKIRFRQAFSDFIGSSEVDWVVQDDAAKLKSHFKILRDSALRAIADEDDF
ncbi:MAG: DUF4468 domain-containing protein [Opitutae bacterium]|jgi:hypothetical protein|nr:DUF4468 domain-containing protein [Opitutae bacterium]